MKEKIEQFILLWSFFIITIISMFVCVNILLSWIKINNDILFSVIYFLLFGSIYLFTNRIYSHFSLKKKYAYLLVPPFIAVVLFFLLSQAA